MIDFNNIRIIKGHDDSVSASLSVSAHFTNVENPDAEEFRSYIRGVLWLKIYQEKKCALLDPVHEAVLNCRDHAVAQRLLEAFDKTFEMAR